jgi:sRNA-binding protein
MQTVEIDRVSPAGNPIAKEKIDGQPLIVYGASWGDTVDVEVYHDEDGKLLGSIVDPTEEQVELAKEQIEKRKERASKIKKLRKKRERHTSLIDRTPDSVDYSDMRDFDEPKTERESTIGKQNSDRSWNDDNKNHLLNKDL